MAIILGDGSCLIVLWSRCMQSCRDLTQSFEVPWCMSDTFHKESGLMIEQCAIDNIALAKISLGPQRCVGGILLTCHNCMWDRCWFASAHISFFFCKGNFNMHKLRIEGCRNPQWRHAQQLVICSVIIFSTIKEMQSTQMYSICLSVYGPSMHGNMMWHALEP